MGTNIAKLFESKRNFELAVNESGIEIHTPKPSWSRNCGRYVVPWKRVLW